MITNKDWYYNLYMDENSNIWAEIVTCRSDKNILEQFMKEKQDRSYRELVFSIWNEMSGYGGNSVFVFKNNENGNLAQQVGMQVKFDDEMANRFKGTDGFTFEMWINFKLHTFFPVMCCLTDRDWNIGFGLFEYTNGNNEENPNTINMFVQDWYQDPNYFTTAPIPDVNEWNHFAGVFSYADNTVRIYRNGQLKNCKTITDHNIQISSDMNLVIGFSDYSGDISYHVIGEFNDIRVWNVARSDTEISEYYNKRITKLNFLNEKEYEGLVFNFYPSVEDTKENIKNKSPNPEYRIEKYDIVDNAATDIATSEVDKMGKSLLSKMWSSAYSTIKKVFK